MRRPESKLPIDPRIVTFFDAASPLTEQYRALRTNLAALSSPSRPVKAFAITSATHGEGKTITAVNLAVVMAQDLNDKKILLVDADMRRSRVCAYLGVPARAGLAEILAGKVELESTLVNIGISNLTVIPAGEAPRNPAELLGSDRMKELINTLRPRFDIIIFDAPPVVRSTDISIFGCHLDGAMMVVRTNRTQKGVVQHAQGLLAQAQIAFLGFILTDIRYYIPAGIYRYL